MVESLNLVTKGQHLPLISLYPSRLKSWGQQQMGFFLLDRQRVFSRIRWISYLAAFVGWMAHSIVSINSNRYLVDLGWYLGSASFWDFQRVNYCTHQHWPFWYHGILSKILSYLGTHRHTQSKISCRSLSEYSTTLENLPVLPHHIVTHLHWPAGTALQGALCWTHIRWKHHSQWMKQRR